MVRQRLGIVGGGLVGLATALKLRERHPDAEMVLWEKEKSTGRHQSTHNSGVLHAGLYYKPGSLKATLAVQGIREMVAFCREHDIAHEICGKLVVAVDETEVIRLRALMERGTANGLKGLEWLDGDALREIEPNAAGLAALRVPEEGIVDYAAVVETMTRILRERGVTIRTGGGVEGLDRNGGDWKVRTADGEDRCDFLINCAGLHCDRIAALAGQKPGSKIIPFRGEYYQIRPERAHLVRHLIYPVPDARFPFLGVHFTRLIGGGIEAGPNAVLAFAREGYSKKDFNLRDLGDSLAYSGLWRFLARHPRMSAEELIRSFSRKRFADSLRRLVPDLRDDDLVPGGAGVRAQAMTRGGDLVQDFDLIVADRAVHVLNAPSPAATASLAIGGHIAGIVGEQLL